MHEFIQGILYFLNGFSLIRQRGLRRFAVGPLLVNIIFFAGVFFLLGHWIGLLQLWLETFLPGWLDWLTWLIWPFALLTMLFIVFYSFVLCANLIAAPFNGLLSERIQQRLTHQTLPSTPIMDLIIKETPRAIRRQLAMLGYFIPRALLLLILFFVPVIQFFAPFLWFIFGAWVMAMQYIDYPMDNNRITLPGMRQQMAQRRWLYLGFGVAVTGFILIPIINCFVMPAAVAAATQLWVEEKQKT